MCHFPIMSRSLKNTFLILCLVSCAFWPCWPQSAVSAASDGEPNLVRSTRSGRIRGVRQKGGNGKDVDMWWGVPYAEPPVGDLRFRAPQPVKRWKGIKDALDKPNSCVQISDTMFPGFSGAEMWNANTRQSEDCLYLNIAVPTTKLNNSAVMVWIYGGSFYSGTSTLDVYDPKILASEQNIIVASLQYRVASLGFLYLGDEGVDGNAGLLDQRLAIKWIRDNIHVFGGNPNNITLFSESAGSASVAFHLLAPGSNPFFSQAILQSAAATNQWSMVTKKEAKLKAMRLAELLKCPHSQEEMTYMVDCLRNANATEMVNKEWDGIAFGIMGCPFTPVYDGVFFPESPKKALEKRHFKNTNILLGTNRNEGYYFIIYYLTDVFRVKGNITIKRSQFETLVKELNLYVKSVGIQAIIYEYTSWLSPNNTEEMMKALDMMVGDYQFTCPTIEFADSYAENFNNVYQYLFDHRASNHPWPDWTGVLHGDEISFIFGEPLNTNLNFTEEEKTFSRDVMTYWANFAKTGNPNKFPNGSWTKVYWPVHSALNREYLTLNLHNKSRGNGFRARKCAFWNNYLPNLLASNEPTNECSSLTCQKQCQSKSTKPTQRAKNKKLAADGEEFYDVDGTSSTASMAPSAHVFTIVIIFFLLVIFTLILLVS
ncbi:acetylcholinesterase-like [Tigriopus californicus]|uniref:acetylcholinesterase-like n=1 Tax=Tigriopus californicus TaxID=6832 RepID=UPI0027DA701D|nr:acetylcholinesterase-like [Tigriopus californicus]XP_059085956.1 acetylcholinesterase-like [Tigriopus californicus]XP_059085958.1 acetylcholinesterase-like [Tigriopus californicus]XP_059085959.1 acetylcholinesterase-like [Tigriopus californicus]XP_059085960.1 acetylcholinesterase-like [Tigriopus californicus]XP_059085961.1 acetylcholinesterase-like [Tigriopus californicus]